MIRCSKLILNPLPSHTGTSSACLLRRNVTFKKISSSQLRCYSSGEPRQPKIFRKFLFATTGLTLIGVGGAVVYAKSDPRFRKVLNSYVPGADTFISIVYQEENTPVKIDVVTEQLSTIKDKAIELYRQISGAEPEKEPPKTVVKEMKHQDQAIKEKPKATVQVAKKAPVVVTLSNDEVEAKLKDLANEALKLYNQAIDSIKDSGSEIIMLIDKSVESVDQKSWNEIRKRIEENKEIIDKLDNTMKEAGDKLKQFSNQMKTAKLPLDSIENLKTLETEVNKAKGKLEDLKNSRLVASTKYFNKIEEARKHFSEELTTLFPSVKLTDKQLKLSEEEIDLFLYYAVQKLLFYQKELNKLEALHTQRLKKAIHESKDDAALIQEAIDTEVDKARRIIKEEFEQKILELKSGCDQEVHNQMKRQEQVHMDILNEQLKLKEKEVERRLIQRLEDKVLEEQGKLHAELADMTGRMQGLNEAISKRALQDQKAQTSQALWSASEALYSCLKNSSSDKDWETKLDPLAEKIDAIKSAAAKGDDLVETVLATIPSKAIQRGVYPEDALRERFLKVEQVAWHVAGVPEGHTSLPTLFVAWLQSMLILKANDPIPSSELNNEPFDPSSLNNYEVIQRARYYIDRGDFEQALRYMNLLKGGARSVSSDWMREVTILLETQQAASLLLAHAAASGMVYS